MSDENKLRYWEDDPFMPEPFRYIFQLIKRQAERGEAFETETQRKFDFIVNQQAQLTATVEKMAAKVDRTADGMSALRQIAEIQSGEIKDLADSVKAIDERQREADARARQTDERLNALIGAVERIISERRNGQN